MIYLSSGSQSFLSASHRVGSMIGPRQGGFRSIKEGRYWAGDNDAFHGKFTDDGFKKHLDRLKPYAEKCLFVTAPDVVGDFIETRKLYEKYKGFIKSYGYPVAWVAQDGATEADIPEDCDAVFIGGSTEYKLSEQAKKICHAAKQMGKWVHIGRVNSKKRSLIAASMLADSVDGTYMRFVGVEKSLPKFDEWMREAEIFKEQLCI